MVVTITYQGQDTDNNNEKEAADEAGEEEMKEGFFCADYEKKSKDFIENVYNMLHLTH